MSPLCKPRRSHLTRMADEPWVMTQELFTAIRDNPIVKVPSDFVLVGRAFGLLALRRCSSADPYLPGCYASAYE